MDRMNATELLQDLRDGLGYRLFPIGEHWVTVATLITALLVLLVAHFASRGLQGALRRMAERRQILDAGTTALAERILHYSVMGVAIAIALQTLGVELATLFAAGAIFAIAIGFAMQNIAENFVSGLLLLGERSIKPGDVLEVEGTVVRVVRMGIRSTVARTWDEEDLIIPNSKLVQGTVKNFTLRDPLYRIRAQVGVSYRSDMHQVMDVLTRTVQGLEWRHETPPQVVLLQFGDSSVDFEARVWIDEPWRAGPLRSALHEAIWFALEGAGITIAYPQMDLHLDAEAVEAMRTKNE